MQMKARLHTHTQILLRIFISSNPQDKNTSTRRVSGTKNAVKNYQRYTKTSCKYAKSQKYSQIMEHN